MSVENSLETNGIIQRHPIAETLTEIVRAKLDGSIRINGPERKAVAYFNRGRLVYAVSNSKNFRLFNVLLSKNKVEKASLAKIPDLMDDIKLSAALVREGKFTEAEIKLLIAEQIEAIMTDALSWTEGTWTFSPLARVREGLRFEPKIGELRVHYARCLPPKMIADRFKSIEETFTAIDDPENAAEMQPHEEFVLSKIGSESMRLDAVFDACRLPDDAAFQALYALWLGGRIERSNWNAAFTERKIAAIRHANVSKVKSAVVPETHQISPPKPVEAETPVETPVDTPITTDAYLEQVENAETFYDILGVDPKTGGADLKRSYFRLAKQFHPDHFHKEGGDLLIRIQRAFTQLANAYETLKTPETRETYDFKIRKELEAKEKRRAAGLSDTPDMDEMQNEYGGESFQAGMDLLLDGDYAGALPHLARAVHFSPENARCHAFFGKALAGDERNRHKAESELQTAIKLEPQNAEFRLMLVEFFLDYDLMKRAEGELNRLLAVDPNNREAKRILAEIKTNAA